MRDLGVLAAAVCILWASAGAQSGVSGGPGAGPFLDRPRDDRPDFAPRDGNPFVLAFAGGSFAPEPGLDQRLLRHPEPHVWCYLMLRGRIADPEKRKQLAALGVELFRPHTWQSWSAQVPVARLVEISQLPFVYWVGWPRPEQKLAPGLRERLARETGAVPVTVSVFESDLDERMERRSIGRSAEQGTQVEEPLVVRIPQGPMRRALDAMGFRYESYGEMGSTFRFHGTATAEVVLRLLAHPGVAFVEPRLVYGRLHDQSIAMIGQDAIRAFYGGGDVTVGIIDSGLWSPTPAQRHLDLQAKWVIGWDVTGDGVWNDLDGHGTHIAGTICGEGIVDRRYLGCSPTLATSSGARLWVGRFLDDGGGMAGDVSLLFGAMGEDKAKGGKRPRLVNCSWGSSGNFDGTDDGCRGVDQWIFDTDQLTVFASGNAAGTTTWSPATAKNALTVGSVDDTMLFTPGVLSGFSSGGTLDDRRKPEVLAPGRSVTSCAIQTTTGYAGLDGTSQAAPHVTGALAALIEHYPQYFDYRPALLRAHACASAEYRGQAGFLDGWHGPREGYGVIDAIKMHGSTRTGGYVGWQQLDQSGQWTSWDWAIPAQVEHAKVVLAWSEPACSQGAAVARLDDLKLVVDWPPYDAAGDQGDLVASHPSGNVVSIAGQAFAGQIAGQVVRVKVFGSSLTTQVKLGVSLIYMTADPAGTVGIGLTLAKDVIKPGETTMAEVTLQAGAATHHFDSARLEPVDPAGFAIDAMFRTTLDGVLHGYTNPIEFDPAFDKGMTVGLGLQRKLAFRLLGVDPGVWPVKMRGSYDPNDMSKTVSKPLCIDGSPPDDLTGLGSGTHQPQVWSPSQLVVVSWDPARDRGCAGIGGLGWVVSQDAPAEPRRPNLDGGAVRLTATLPSDGRGQYVNLRAFDRAGNASRLASLGPLLVDAEPPVLDALTIDGGAAATASPLVKLALAARDRPSGVAEMRFSGDGATWSAWQPFAPALAYDLRGNGGGSAPGSKRVVAEVRDRAGNPSERREASIVWLAR